MNDAFVAVVNSAAGHGRCKKLAPAAIERLRAQGLSVDVRSTSAPGDATRIAQEAAAQGYRRFISVGGDGTAYEILNGLSSHLDARDPAERVSLGFLPLGTGNSFLRDFGSGDLDQAFGALVERRTRACDVVRLTHDEGVLHFMNLLSFGFVADVCTVTNARFKPMGAAGYAFGVVATLAQLGARPLRMQLDGKAVWEQDVTFVSFNNSRFTGGNMMMAPYADTADGELDVIVCGQMTRLTLLETFPKIFRGHHVHHHAITCARAKVVELSPEGAIDLMIDGEIVRNVPRRLEVVAGAIDVFV